MIGERMGGGRLHQSISGSRWQCEKCGCLLGVIKNQKIHVRCRDSSKYLIAGEVVASCRRCGELNQIKT